MKETVCVFCGSRFGTKGQYRDAAIALGTCIGQSGMNMVFGGGGSGLMGIVSQAALKAGAEVTGFIPKFLMDVENPEQNLTKLYVTENMSDRKKKMIDMADYFVILPGGVGTLEETFEVMTGNWLKLYNKPLGFLNVEGFYDNLFTFLHSCQEEEFISQSAGYLWTSDSDPQALLGQLKKIKEDHK